MIIKIVKLVHHPHKQKIVAAWTSGATIKKIPCGNKGHEVKSQQQYKNNEFGPKICQPASLVASHK